MKGRLFVLDDDELICSMLQRSLKKEGYEVQAETTTEKIIEQIKSWQPDLVLLDIHIEESRSGLDILEELKKEDFAGQIVMLTADNSVETAITAMKLGATDYLTKPFNMQEVSLVISKLLDQQKLRDEVDYLRRSQVSSTEERMVGDSQAMQELRALADRLAEAQVPIVLITGESGTGKEVMARYIHNKLQRNGSVEYMPFLAVNCTALPEHLVESELFGHNKGAFTGAISDKKGIFEMAHGGSILLDEIGEMDIGLQTKLLRVIEERKVRRLGGKIDIALNVTVIVTTNTNLEEAVETNLFRSDLFYRLNAFRIHLPPLRERREDILLLAEHYLESFSRKYNKKGIKGFSNEASELLKAHDWTGNIRELRNVVERIVVLENTEWVQPEHLAIVKVDKIIVERRKSAKFMLPAGGISLEELEKDLIEQALRRVDNNQSKAARLLHLSYDSLRYQIKKFNLN